MKALRLLLVGSMLVATLPVEAAKKPCTRGKCRSKVSTLSLGIWQPASSQLALDEASPEVTTAPVTVSYLSNYKMGKSSVFHLSLEAFFSPVSYVISDVKRTGNYVLAGIGLGSQWMFRSRNFLHGIYWRFVAYPYSQFSVKSTSATQITDQGQTDTVTTQTILIYSGQVAGRLELGFLRYGAGFGKRANIHYGLAFNYLHQTFSKKIEQSLQKSEGQEANLRSPTETPVSATYSSTAIALVFGMDM